MKIIVIRANGPSITLDINPDESVGSVKAMLESETGVASQQQQLLCNGTEMENNENLSGLGIGDGAVIRMAANAPSSDFEFNSDRPAVNPNALQLQMQHDPDLMGQLIQKDIDGSLATSLDYNPEEVTRVAMLYGDMEINEVPIRAMVDTGAQSTIISKGCAERCGLLNLMEHYNGLNIRADQSEIIGRIHVAPLKIGHLHFPCSLTVLDLPSAELLVGLDMLRKHECIIDLKDNVLKVGGGEVCVPFVTEKDVLDEQRHSVEAPHPASPVSSGAKGSNVVLNGSQSAGDAAADGCPQVSLGSPALGSPPGATKGYGLKKWRRLKRDPGKSTTPSIDSATRSKRNYANNNSLVEMNKKVEGSISIDGMAKSPIAFGDSSLFVEPDAPAGIPTFSPGVDSDNSEDRCSMSSTAASAPKSRHDLTKLTGHPRDKHRTKHFSSKHFVGNANPLNKIPQPGMIGQVDGSKKPRGEAIVKYPHSSLESDSRSSNTVFTRGATSAYVNGESAVAYYGRYGENHPTEGLPIGVNKKIGREGKEFSPQDDAELAVGVGRNKNNQISESKDILVNCVCMLESAQDALEREIQKFGELGKHLRAQGSEDSIRISEASSEYVGPGNLNDAMKAKVMDLTRDVELLEKQLKEANVKLLEKTSRLVELEGTVWQQRKLMEVEAELESVFKQKLKAEIEYFAIKDAVKIARNQMKLLAEQECLGSTQKLTRTMGNLESEAETLHNKISSSEEVWKMLKRVAKRPFYFCIPLIMFAVVLYFVLVRLRPKASVVIPT